MRELDASWTRAGAGTCSIFGESSQCGCILSTAWIGRASLKKKLTKSIVRGICHLVVLMKVIFSSIDKLQITMANQ